ncbi:MAG: hypothetical protein RLZZ127_2034, partial [Planctomycetota bacterium]
YLLNYATDIYGWQITTAGNDPGTAADDAVAGQKIAAWHQTDSSGHAMTIVGYNDDIWVDTNGNGSVDSAEKGALKIVNSWGNWQNGGFCWVSYDALRATSMIPSFGSWTGGTNRAAIFWSNSVYWINARPSHSPSLLAELRLSTAKRNQLVVNGRTSGTGTTTPASSAPTSVSYAGGAFGFSGTATAVEATIVLDLSDLVTTGSRRYYGGVQDTTAADAVNVTGLRLTDASGATVSAAITTSPAGGLPQSADGATLLAWADTAVSDGTAPSAITDLGTTYESPTAVTLGWTAPGDDGRSGKAASYDVRWSAGSVASAWAGATQASGEPAPAITGSGETFQVTGLQPGTAYTFAMTATDDAGNTSALSNVVAITTPTTLDISTSATLPTATAGAPYSTAFAATGGAPTYTWAAVSGFGESDAGTGAALTGGTAKNWRADDSTWTYTFPTGFTFPFLGVERTSVSVSSNGFLDFSNSVTAYTGTTTLMSTKPLIAVFWTDLVTNQTNGDIFITESADEVVIRWAAQVYGQTSKLVNAQARLFRDGRIRLEYGSAITGVGSQYIGVAGTTAPTYSAYHQAASIPAGAQRLFAVSALPAGLALDAATGVLSGTLAEGGSRTFGIIASDSGYPVQTCTRTFLLPVVVGNLVPAIPVPATAEPAELSLP